MSLKLGKVLLVRLDRIGDLVLTLPIDEGLRKIDPKAEIRWWIPRGLGFVPAQGHPVRQTREIDLKFDSVRFRMLLDELKQDPPKLAIVFHAPWWVSLLLFLARVPVRAGPRSQWHQLLFFNRRIRQKRSRAEFHELEYNFQLAEAALKLGQGWLPRSHLRLQSRTSADTAPESVARFDLIAGQYIVVHPGMGGSALNWPSPMYAQLIQRLTEQIRVVVTGTAADEAYLRPIRDMLAGNKNVTWLNKLINGQQLITVLKHAKACVAPSTGVLHLAASCGTPTVGLFSPVRVQTAKRWGPKGDHTTTLTPAVECPGTFKCLGAKCRHFDCMQRITVGSVEDAIEQVVSHALGSSLTPDSSSDFQ